MRRRNSPAASILALFDRAATSILALFDRAAARDFADVYVLVQRYGKALLLELAQAIDAGLDHDVLATYLRTLTRFADHELPVAPRGVRRSRLQSNEIAEDSHGIASIWL